VHPVLFHLRLGALTVPVPFALVALGIGVGVAVLVGGAERRLRAVLATVALLAGAWAAWTWRGARWILADVALTSYGVCLFIGVAGAVFLWGRAMERVGATRAVSSAAWVPLVVGGLLGGRLGYVVMNPAAFSSRWEILDVSTGGLSLVGAGIGAAVLLPVARRGAKFSHRVALDASALALPWLGSWAAAGSYLAGSDHGRMLGGDAPGWFARLGTFPRWPESLPPGVDGPPVLLQQIASGVIASDALATLPVQPIQLYELFVCTTLMGLAWASGTGRRAHGHLGARIFLGYAAWRLVAEWLRGDGDRGLLAWEASPLMWWGLLVLPLAAGLVALGLVSRGRPRLRATWMALAGLLLLMSYFASRDVHVVSVAQVLAVVLAGIACRVLAAVERAASAQGAPASSSN
jgi:prolipoprotein diacylglyceryltransferase